jgi:hypothetical protein
MRLVVLVFLQSKPPISSISHLGILTEFGNKFIVKIIGWASGRLPFLIDTDALVHVDGRPHSDRVYQSLQGFCERGEVKTVTQVFDELKRFDGVRARFWPHRDAMKVDQYHVDVLSFVGYISDTFEFLYDLSGSKNPDPADPWLIGCARVFGYTLVTDERPQSVKKIPFVCRQQNVQVPCINGAQMLERLGCG